MPLARVARVVERLALELSLPVLMTQVCCDRASNPDLPHMRGDRFTTEPPKWYLIIVLFLNNKRRPFSEQQNPEGFEGDESC